jgi:hypothetical protein
MNLASRNVTHYSSPDALRRQARWWLQSIRNQASRSAKLARIVPLDAKHFGNGPQP